MPYVFWFVGGTDPQMYTKAKQERQLNTIPSNHSPASPRSWIPRSDGPAAMLSAASAWLSTRRPH